MIAFKKFISLLNNSKNKDWHNGGEIRYIFDEDGIRLNFNKEDVDAFMKTNVDTNDNSEHDGDCNEECSTSADNETNGISIEDAVDMIYNVIEENTPDEEINIDHSIDKLSEEIDSVVESLKNSKKTNEQNSQNKNTIKENEVKPNEVKPNEVKSEPKTQQKTFSMFKGKDKSEIDAVSNAMKNGLTLIDLDSELSKLGVNPLSGIGTDVRNYGPIVAQENRDGDKPYIEFISIIKNITYMPKGDIHLKVFESLCVDRVENTRCVKDYDAETNSSYKSYLCAINGHNVMVSIGISSENTVFISFFVKDNDKSVINQFMATSNKNTNNTNRKNKNRHR